MQEQGFRVYTLLLYSMPLHPFCFIENVGRQQQYMGTLERIYGKRFQVFAGLYLELFPVMNISLFPKIGS